jgi:hypothetical protein
LAWQLCTGMSTEKVKCNAWSGHWVYRAPGCSRIMSLAMFLRR